MKFSVVLSLFLVVPAFVSAAAVPQSAGLVARQFRGNRNGGQRGGQRGGAKGQGANGNNANNNANNNNNKAAAANATATPPAAGVNNAVNATGAANNAAGGNANNANNGDPQTSLTLLQSVIATGFASNGQEANADPGQVPSLTSTNNFINFCATVPNLPITNGLQIKTGSCNPAPMGVIASTSNMPSSKFVVPPNGGTIPANQPFTIQMAIRHIQTGNFVNAQTNYYSAPQQVNGAGDIIGHTHVVVEKLTSLGQTDPTDPGTFAFFKGINTAADGNGVVSTDVTAGLPAGFYRIASINAAENHQPVLVAVAQHGTLDDMAYFTVQ